MNDIASLFRGCATSHISDTLGRLPGTTHLRPMHRSGALLGLALTVRVRSGDTLIIHKALQHLQPGQVLVIDGDGDSRRALVGEIMKRVAQARGCVGFVVDGAIRDLDAFAADDFPCFARAVTHRGPYSFDTLSQTMIGQAGGRCWDSRQSFGPHRATNRARTEGTA